MYTQYPCGCRPLLPDFFVKGFLVFFPKTAEQFCSLAESKIHTSKLDVVLCFVFFNQMFH